MIKKIKNLVSPKPKDLVDIYTLEVGTKFQNIESGWVGEIVLLNQEKYIFILDYNTHSSIPIYKGQFYRIKILEE